MLKFDGQPPPATIGATGMTARLVTRSTDSQVEVWVQNVEETRGCHVFLFDSGFREIGFHSIRIDEPRPYFCNAVLSAGVADKARNELLLTVQYFPVDGKVASSVSEIGSGWRRMTVRLRLRAEPGGVTIEQDDGCLGNPNRIDTVPDARERLRRCQAASAGR